MVSQIIFLLKPKQQKKVKCQKKQDELGKRFI